MTKAAAIRQTHVARPWLTPEQIGELMGCAAGSFLIPNNKSRDMSIQHDRR